MAKDTITLAEAEAMADQWRAQLEDYERQPTASCYRDASPHDLIRMWKTGKGLDGKKRTKREFGCLVEAWVERFGALPPGNDDGDPATPVTKTAPEPPPANDTMLRMADVERLTGITKSTIKRMMADGRFPKPMKLGVRAIGWPAADVRTFIATLDEQRRRTRQ